MITQFPKFFHIFLHNTKFTHIFFQILKMVPRAGLFQYFFIFSLFQITILKGHIEINQIGYKISKIYSYFSSELKYSPTSWIISFISYFFSFKLLFF